MVSAALTGRIAVWPLPVTSLTADVTLIIGANDIPLTSLGTWVLGEPPSRASTNLGDFGVAHSNNGVAMIEKDHSASAKYPSLAPAKPDFGSSAKSDEQSAVASRVAPSLSLPKGGGAIRGIGEKFAANPVTGTGRMTVPISTSAGRSGFGPQLSLSYDSGSGNGPFGFGWTLSLPTITRKTDKGLPQYDDAAESDVFILSGAEDLVPVYRRDLDGEWIAAHPGHTRDAEGFWVRDAAGRMVIHEDDVDGYRVRRYRPRIEGLFAVIERWTNLAVPSEVHWRSISRDNTLTIYGLDSNARIADPVDATHIFTWLICETHDDKGNGVLYRYKAEDGVGVELDSIDERNRGPRDDVRRTANRYLKRIHYGNQRSLLDGSGRPRFLNKTQIDAQIASFEWMFEVVFDYGDHDPELPTPRDDESRDLDGELRYPWRCRPDPFSTYRPRFELRTARVCQRVLMFHHFPGTESSGVGTNCLVRSTDFRYSDEADPTDVRNPVYTFLREASQTGYRRGLSGYDHRSLPPVAFEYTQPAVQDTVDLVDPESLQNLPIGVDGSSYRWTDLHGEGIQGILSEWSSAWMYKRNLSPIPTTLAGGHKQVKAKFAPLETVAAKPNASLRDGAVFMDLAGDGLPDLVTFDDPTPGLYEHDRAEGWGPYRPFTSRLSRDFRDPNLKLVDLDGDGLLDVLISEDEAFIWHPSQGEAGFGAERRVSQSLDEQRGARVVFADGTESIYLADLSGDGLTDLVRIRNGEVCYWPNLGYGHFGAKVTMRHSPCFDHADRFDQRRIRLADIDGSGTTDIIYLHPDGARLYFNQSGNSWSEPTVLNAFPCVDNAADVAVVDLLGNGTACLVWSSPLASDASRQMRYVNLMGAHKPHLLVKIINNLGAETLVQYAPSTQFYLQDKRDGKHWLTRLPFPVHVVERIEAFDHVSRNRFVTRFAYHHGYFDGEEREFRGFGMVEQWDTEAFEDYVVGVQGVGGAQELTPELVQPPLTTRTWFHTGAILEGALVLHQYRHEYYLQEDHVPEPGFPSDVSIQELGECTRALKGLLLRQEIYSFDGTSDALQPYTVTENAFELRRLQPRDYQRHAVFFPIASQTVGFNYERNPLDPRVSHSLALERDELGNVRKSCSIVYGRQLTESSLPPEVTRNQQRRYIAYTETEYTPDIELGSVPTAYRARVPFESRSYEVTGIVPDASRFGLDEIKAKIEGADSIGYEIDADDVAPQKRLLSHSRSLFVDDTLSPLPLGQWDSLGLVYKNFTLGFTPPVVATHYAGQVSDAEFDAAGYVHFDGDNNWWIPSGTAIFPSDPRAHFYLAVGFKDPLGVETIAAFDQYDLLIERVEVRQATWNVTAAVNDYRVLGPVLLTEPNKNRAAVEHDELGVVVKTAVMGKAGTTDGDTLTDPTTRMEYELFNWMNDQKPNCVHTFAREKHGAANPRWLESYAYSNGGGSVAMSKAQVNPGRALRVNPDGTTVEVDADPRWVGNGRTILNNKGKPVKQYEPYFSTTHEYEDEAALREIGVSPIYYYDPVGRNVRTLFPNGTLGRVEFNSWAQRVFDANDTVKETKWYTDRGSPDPATESEPLNDPERRAAWLAAKHANTPGVVQFDSLGRSVYAVSDYGGGITAAVRCESDLTGRHSMVFDQAGRAVASAFAGMAGTPILNESAERGRRWIFANVLGSIVKTWDEHGRQFRAEYDSLHRLVSSHVQEAGKTEIVFNYVVYGDQLANAEQLNLLGTAHQIFDQAGMVRVLELDFKGNPRAVERVFARDYKNSVDWSVLATQADYDAIQTAANAVLEATESFVASSDYDALNRPTTVTLPEGTVLVPTYNEASFLSSLRAQIMGQGPFVEFLKAQDYDAKGQRQFAHHGNEVFTRYFYDPKTFRLVNLLTCNSSADPQSQALQNLHYSYDPSGNITQIRDLAQQTHYFANAVVEPEALYEYDAVYQLVRATGRELAAQANDTIRIHSDLEGVPQLPHINDTQAVRTYREEYEYDLVGNLKVLRHRFQGQPGIGSGWTRHYRYSFEDVPGERTNRLAATSMPGDPESGPFSGTYDHDAYGNMIRMPHLAAMDWSFMDQLRRVDLGGGGTAYYVYDLGGQRVRKVVERNGSLNLESIYLGAVMAFRRRRRNTGQLEFERWTVHIRDNTGHVAQVDTKTRDDANIDPDNPLNVPLIRYQYSNQLGSAMLETDESGSPVSYEEYHPYGTTAYRSAKAGLGISLKRFRFSGKERDDETGLYYFGARYYAPWLGRWASADPLGFVSGFNLFRYCANSPVMFSDPSGTEEVRYSLKDLDLTGVKDPGEAAQRMRGQGFDFTGFDAKGKELAPDESGKGVGLPKLENGNWNVGTWLKRPGEGEGSSASDEAPIEVTVSPPEPESAPTADAPSGAALEAAGGATIRNNPPGRTLEVPPTVDDAKLARLREGVRQRTVGRNTGPVNPTAARRNSPAQQNALAQFNARPRPANTVAGHRIDMQYDLTGRIGENWRDYIPENGATNTNDGFDGFRRLRSHQQGVPVGAVVRPNEAGSLRHSPGFRGAMRGVGTGLTAAGFGLSGYGLYRDIEEGDVSMGIGDAMGVAGGGLELYAAGHAFASGTTVGGATVAGVAALPLGIALSGVALGVTSGVSGYRSYQRGDAAGAVAGGAGVLGGGLLAAGGGIALASAAGVAMAPALIAAAPVLIAAGAIIGLGVGAFHLGRYLSWW